MGRLKDLGETIEIWSRRGMRKLSGKRTISGRYSGKRFGTEEAIFCYGHNAAEENLSGKPTEAY